MPRFCSACGRDIRDHKVDGTRPNTTPARRGRVAIARVRNYVCRVRPIARDLRVGRYVPDERRRAEQNLNDVMQRTEENDAKFVHEDRLAMGGDLHS